MKFEILTTNYSEQQRCLSLATPEFVAFDNLAGTSPRKRHGRYLAAHDAISSNNTSSANVGAWKYNYAGSKPNIFFDDNRLRRAFGFDTKFRHIKRGVVPVAVHDLAACRDKDAVADRDTFLCVYTASVDAAIATYSDRCSPPIRHQLDRTSHVDVIAQIKRIDLRSASDS